MTTQIEIGDRVWFNTAGLKRFRPVRRWEIVATVVGWVAQGFVRIKWDSQEQPDTVEEKYLKRFDPNVLKNRTAFHRRFLVSRLRRYL